MAGALMNRLAKDRFRAFSAAAHLKGELHPLAIEILKQHGLATEGLASKSWEQFVSVANDRIDIIIAIYDRSIGEACPVLPGRSLTACWNVADPVMHLDRPAEGASAFQRVFRELENRIRLMACLRLDAIDRLSLPQRMDRGAAIPQTESRA